MLPEIILYFGALFQSPSMGYITSSSKKIQVGIITPKDKDTENEV